MNFYPVYGHIGFKLFFAWCAFNAFEHSRSHLEAKRNHTRTLGRIANAIERLK